MAQVLRLPKRNPPGMTWIAWPVRRAMRFETVADPTRFIGSTGRTLPFRVESGMRNGKGSGLPL